MKAGTVGQRMKTYRENLELSIEELSERSGVSVRVISEIEEHEAYPSLQPLVRMARALGQRLGTFLDDGKAGDPHVVRMADRQESMVMHNDNCHATYRYVSLAGGKSDRHMEPFYIEITPASEREAKRSHEGEEFLVVLSGTIRLEYGIEVRVLEEGDSTYYNSVVPHAVSAVGGPAEIYAVVYLPL